jgi:sulfur-carrier protein
MSVMFRIPDYLASFTGQRTSITLEDSPQTVGQALELLWNRFPGLHDRLVDEQSRLRPQLNVFIANNPIPQKDGLTTALSDGASISIFPALGISCACSDAPM